MNSVGEENFSELPENHYRDVIQLLQNLWNKCFEIERDSTALKTNFIQQFHQPAKIKPVTYF